MIAGWRKFRRYSTGFIREFRVRTATFGTGAGSIWRVFGFGGFGAGIMRGR